MVQTHRQLLPTAEMGTAQKEFPVIKVYCASYAFSGVWAFSPEAVKAFAPLQMLTKSAHSSGEIWEAQFEDLDGPLWSFTPVC